MAAAGQRFVFDPEEDNQKGIGEFSSLHVPPSLDVGFVRDITERSSNPIANPPSLPILKNTANGFPAHKKRSKPSAFRHRRRDGEAASTSSCEAKKVVSDDASTPLSHISKTTHPYPKNLGSESSEEIERRRINEENKQRIAQMSPAQIEQERLELMSGLSSSLIEKLLKRANIDEDTESKTQPEGGIPNVDASAEESPVPLKASTTRVAFSESEKDTNAAEANNISQTLSDPDAPPKGRPVNRYSVASKTPLAQRLPIHFPQPPASEPLDPSSPDFLENLRTKYFPHLPVDPTKLSWMAPLPTEGSPADLDSPYNPSQSAIPTSSIRFDFRGRLLPPKLSRQIPVTAGLHHHGVAPEAAGYTIAELAILARSTQPSQRCIAYQTLGRILYRLGRGEYGDEGDDLYEGLWQCVKEGNVLSTLVAEAGRDEGRGNRSAWATATEAVWLWRKAGGKRWKAE